MGLNFFDKILYINLDIRKDRNENILNELSKLEVDKNKIVRIEAVYEPLNGHKGCALSHIKALDYAIKNNFKNVLILEDDALFQYDKKFIDKHIKNFFKKIDNWDVFFLGGNIQKKENTSYKKIFKVKRSLCSHAYVVNKHYFERLKECFIASFSLLDNCLFFNQTLGLPLDCIWQILEERDNWYIQQPIIVQQSSSYSDIMLTQRDRKHII